MWDIENGYEYILRSKGQRLERQYSSPLRLVMSKLMACKLNYQHGCGRGNGTPSICGREKFKI